jgi:N-methylhydantoinase A
MIDVSRRDPAKMKRIGSDIGGTFTDVAAVDETGRLFVGKQLTTHGNEANGVINALREGGIDVSGAETILAHGTTLVINALLERKGSRVALVTSRGFRDVLALARSSRPDVLNLRYRRDDELVPAELRFEVGERTLASGEVTEKPAEAELDELISQLKAAKVAAVAVCFLNSYAEPAMEQYVTDYLAAALPGISVGCSSDVSRQWREWERFTTSSANAYVAPVTTSYIDRLEGALAQEGLEGEFLLLDSNGGALDAPMAKKHPIRLVESGPVGGVIGALDVAKRHQISKMVTFDMGGTTAKSALVESGRYETTDLYWVNGYKTGLPLQVRCVDVTEVGAGGGSIAWVDDAGSLTVGPRSAGSSPGPVCYGLGGTEVTVTDANLYLGRLSPAEFSASITLDHQAMEQSLNELGGRLGISPLRAALGVVKLANLSMARAVMNQTIERGRDPREYVLLAIGGAGPMHACEVAAEAHIKTVMVPLHPGHFSAIGMLSANLRRSRRQPFRSPLSEETRQALNDSLRQIVSELRASWSEGPGANAGASLETRYALALRYVGQDHTLLIPGAGDGSVVSDDFVAQFRDAFEAEYEQRYGRRGGHVDIEAVEIEVTIDKVLPAPEIRGWDLQQRDSYQLESYFSSSDLPVKTTVLHRSSLQAGTVVDGPALVVEPGATTVLPPGASGRVGDDGTIMVDVSGVRT